MKTINRRRSPRLEIKLRCHVTAPALWVNSAMYTENISRSGLLMVWRGEGANAPVPALGQMVTVEVELPAHHGFGQKCIHVQGSVIRVTMGQQDAPRVALQINYMDFREFHEPASEFEILQPAANSWTS